MARSKVSWSGMASALLVALSVSAAQAEEVAIQGGVDPFSMGQLLQTLAALLITCVLALLIVGRVLPRFLGVRKEAEREGQRLFLRDRLRLSPKQEVILLEVKDRGECVLASGDDGVRVIATFFGEQGEGQSEERK